MAVRFPERTADTDRFLKAAETVSRGEIDVRYTGRAFKRAASSDASWHQTRQRPLRIGSSLGHYAITAGTLGLFAVHRPTGKTVIVSNNHVLANEDRASLGDKILQPGAEDGGRLQADTVATLFMAQPLMETGNVIDAAIALVEPYVTFDARDLGSEGMLVGVRDTPLEPGERVTKIGRTTGVTLGEVTAVELDGYEFCYDAGLLSFDQQIEIAAVDLGNFSAGGDSGSLILDEDRRAAGLLFAGSEVGGPFGQGLTYANNINAVLAAFDLELALGGENA